MLAKTAAVKVWLCLKRMMAASSAAWPSKSAMSHGSCGRSFGPAYVCVRAQQTEDAMSQLQQVHLAMTRCGAALRWAWGKHMFRRWRGVL